MKKVYLVLLFFLPLFCFAQTTVLHETFGNSATSPYSGGTSTIPSGPSITYSVSTTTGVISTVLNASDAYLNIIGNGSNGRDFLTAPFSSLPAGFNTTLSGNTGPVTWTFNMKTSRTTVLSSSSNTSYSDGSYYSDVVLTSTGSNLTTTPSGPNGYVVILQRSSADASKNSIRLSRFSNGLVAGSSGSTYTMLKESPAFTALTNSISVKVVYTPSTDTWELFYREDPSATFVDPTTGSFTSAGTAVDGVGTYTSTPMTHFGFLACHSTSTAAANSFQFDNYKITVTPISTSYFYYDGSGSLASVTNWTINSDGSGSGNPINNPSNFTNNNQAFVTKFSATTDAAWTVSGSGSKIIVGDPAVAGVSLTIASGFGITGTIDATSANSGSNSIVLLEATTIPTFGILHSSSEVHLQNTLTLNSSPNFGKLFIDGSNKTVTFGAFNPSVQTSLTVASNSIFIPASTAANYTSFAPGATATINGTTKIAKLAGLVVVSTPGNNGGVFQFAGSENNLTLGASSVVEYNKSTNASTYNISGRSYVNLTISGLDNNKIILAGTSVSGTLTLNITGTSGITGFAGLTMGSGATIVRTAGSLDAAPTFGSSVNVTYNGTSAISSGFEIPVSSSTLNNLTLNNSGGITLTANTTVNGIVTVTQNAIVNAGVTLTVNNKLLMNGAAASTITASGATIVYGSGATLEYARSGSSTVGDEWPAAGSPANVNITTSGVSFIASSGTNRVIPAGGSMTINGAAFSVNAGNTLNFANSSTIVKLTAHNFNQSGGVYTFGSAGTDIINIVIGSGTATPVTIQASGELTSNGPNLIGSYNLTVFPGFTYNLANSPRTVANLTLNGTINDAAFLDAAILNVKGNITGTGTHTTNFTTGKIVMIGNTSSSNISGATFANLDLNDADGFALTGTPAITGTLSLTNGSLNNSTNNISLGNGATVNRSAGSFTANPSYGTGVNVNYTGTGSVNSGFEITPAAGSIAALSVTGSGGTYTLASSPSITSLTVNSGSTLNAAALTITNSGTSTINGNFKTAHASGVAGSISGSAPTIGSSSTVEYYSGSAQAVDLTSFANLTLSGAGAKTFSANTTVTGNFASSGGAVTAPTLMTFNGTAQNIAGLAFTDVTFSTSGTKSMTSDASVSGSLTVNGTAVLDADGTSDNKVFTLRSNSTSTALVAEGAPGGGYITGNITIERYTSDKRAWRLLSAPISSGQTIRKAWMEDSVNNNGYGTHITTFTGDPNAANFDAEKPASSIRTFANPGSTWSTTPNTTSAINAEQGYMLFVRGNRTIDLNDITAHTAATLRITGTLKQGTQSAVSVPYSATDYTLVGNPFASPIDYEYLYNNASPALSSSFYIWDANLAGTYGVGGYRLVTRTGAGTYEQTPAGGSAATNNSMRYIHSGQAFLANATSGGGTTNLVIAEAGKATSVSDIFPFTPTTIDEEMTINMSVVETDLSVNLTDGTRSKYNSGYDAALTDEDNRKISNFNENLGIARDGEKLIVERRPVIGTTDTTYLSISNMKQKNYQLDINTYNLNHTLLLGKIVDNFTATSSPLNLNGNTIFNFTVTSDPASSATDRFKVIFYTGGPLPVTFTGIKAVQQANDIAVEWKVENQTNIKQYEVEKSTDGRSFTNVGTQIATGANGTAATYNWLDVHAVSGDNFYRVKSIGLSGDVQYTGIVKVRMGKGVPAITVYPNPVTDRVVTVQFTDMVKGNYTINLVNNLGQTVQSKLISHNGANAAQSFSIDRGVAKGNYQLQVVKPGGEKEVMKLVIAE